MKKLVIIFVIIFLFYPFLSQVKASPSQQQTIWYNPKTFECTTRPSFDEHGSIRFESPWIEGNQSSLIICSVLDINNFSHFQGLLILTLIPLLIIIILVNLVRKKSKSQTLRIIIITTVIYITLFCWIGLLGNLRTLNSYQDEFNPSTNLSNYLDEQSTEIKLNLLVGITIPAMYIIFKLRGKRKLQSLTK